MIALAHSLISGLSWWAIVLLVLTGLVAILIFVKVFESDFFDGPD